MPMLKVEYRVKGYKMSDAMRPDPGWGRRIFTVNTEDIGTDDMNEVERMAKDRDAVPVGFSFFSIVKLAH